jgi:phenylacetate-CoA ligase
VIARLLTLRRLLRNQRLSADELRALQESKLRSLVEHAYRNVPHYRSLFESVGLAPEDVRTLDDLEHIPVSTKQDLRAAGLERRASRTVDLSSCHKAETAGSTGKPFAVYVTRSERLIRRLLHFRALLAAGFRVRDRVVMLGGTLKRRPGLHERLGLYRMPSVVSRLKVDEQVRLLRTIRPDILWAYPTVLHGVRHSFGRPLSELIQPRTVITSGEVLSPWLRRVLDTELDAELFNFYGCVEVGRMAFECPAHEGLHVCADHVILECVEDGRPVPRGESGAVVVTDLDSYTTPLIRYGLGDVCAYRESACSCGMSLPLIAPPEGRLNEMLRLPSGQLISPFLAVTRMDAFPELEQVRVIQDRPDHLEVLIVLQKPCGPEPLEQMRANISGRLEEAMQVDIRVVDAIDDDHRKFRAFISKLSS